MASSFTAQLSFSFFLLILLSPKIQAREGKLFSFFTHVREPRVFLTKAKAPAPALITAPAPAPESSIILESAPAPEPEPDFVDRGDGYGLYGSGATQFPPTKETPKTTTFENELLYGETNGESFKTGYPKTKLYNNEVYRNNYNNEEYRSNYNGNSYSNNHNGNGYSNNYNGNGYSNNYNGNGYSKNYVDSYSNNYNGNGYERKREGMSDTRFMENGKYYYDGKNENENYGSESVGRGRTENYEGYYEKNKYPNEFNTMEEYEKQQESQGYVP